MLALGAGAGELWSWFRGQAAAEPDAPTGIASFDAFAYAAQHGDGAMGRLAVCALRRHGTPEVDPAAVAGMADDITASMPLNACARLSPVRTAAPRPHTSLTTPHPHPDHNTVHVIDVLQSVHGASRPHPRPPRHSPARSAPGVQWGGAVAD